MAHVQYEFGLSLHTEAGHAIRSTILHTIKLVCGHRYPWINWSCDCYWNNDACTVCFWTSFTYRGQPGSQDHNTAHCKACLHRVRIVAYKRNAISWCHADCSLSIVMEPSNEFSCSLYSAFFLLGAAKHGHFKVLQLFATGHAIWLGKGYS